MTQKGRLYLVKVSWSEDPVRTIEFLPWYLWHMQPFDRVTFFVSQPSARLSPSQALSVLSHQYFPVRGNYENVQHMWGALRWGAAIEAVGSWVALIGEGLSDAPDYFKLFPTHDF